MIDENHRRLGIGEKLMAWIEVEGKRHNCQIVKLEAYAANIKARAFYERLKYDELGVVILRPLSISEEQWQAKLEHKVR